MRKRQISAVAVAIALAACAAPAIRPAPFRSRPDSIARGDLLGPFDGRVVDTDTQRPIAGALVQATWTFVEGFGMVGPAGYREWVGSTDAQGYYNIPRLADVPSGGRPSDFGLVIYKKGYVAFRSDRRFEDFGPRTDFTQVGTVVELSKWRDDLSHLRHLRYAGGGAAMVELTAWEIPAAVAELSGQKPTSPRPPVPGAAGAVALDVDDLLTPADLKKVTGFEGAFDVANLADEPSSPSYDSAHLQARGREETFDAALRVWRLSGDEAQKQYQRLLVELPHVIEKNEIGDKSLRATSDKGDVLAVAYIDAKRNVVVVIQCGVQQCRSHEVLMQLLRLVKDRADVRYPIGGGP